eukprot:IDg2491t1
MDSSDAGGIKVEKLNETNFHTWKTRIKLLLSVRELKAHIEEDSPERDASSYPKFVCEFETANEMWTTIINIFERHTLLNKLAARRNFYTANMRDIEKIRQFANRIRQLASTLRSMSVDIDDNEMEIALLNGLPNRF